MPYPRTTLLPLTTADAASIGGAASLSDATPLPKKVIPALQMTKDATVYLNIVGRYTSTGTPGTITFGVYLGTKGTAIGSATLIAASSALTVVATQTNKTWQGEFQMEILSIGAGGAGVGQVRGSGRLMGITSGGIDLVPATAPMTAVNIDNTSDQYIAIGLTPSVTTGTWIVHSVDAEISAT